MAAQKGVVNSIASYFFETNLIEKFIMCYEEEISNNEFFQQKLSELSSLEYDNFQGNEFFIKKMIETNKDYQFIDMKNKLFEKFNTILSGIMKIPMADASEATQL